MQATGTTVGAGSSSATGAPTKSSFQKFVGSVQRGMFGLGFVLSKDAPLLSFPLSDNERLPWSGSPGVGTLSSSLTFLSRAISANESPVAFLSLLIVTFAWISCYLGLSFSVAARFSEDEPQSELALRALRVMTSLSTGPLYIPMSTVILQGVACHDDNWINTDLSCSHPGRVAMALLLCLGLVGFTSLAVFASLIWVDRSPASLSWGARQHGRFDAAMIVIKLLLGFCYAVLSKQLVGTVFMVVILMALGLGQTYLYSFAPVFVQRDINAMYAGGGMALFFASTCLLIAQLAGPEQAYLCVFFGVPMAFTLGFFAARRRLDLIGRGHLRQCQSLADVHVWARRRMQRYAALKHLSERSGISTSAVAAQRGIAAEKDDDKLGADSVDDEGDGYAHDDAEMRDSASANGDAAISVADDGSVASGPSMGGDRSVASVRSRHRRPAHDKEPSTSDTSALLARGVSLQVADQLSLEDMQSELKRVKAEAERGYQYGMERFNRDEMAFIQYGVFSRQFSKFSFLECVALSRALRLNPSVDSRFYIFTRIRALRESDGSGLSPVDRVLFDGAFKEAQGLRLQAFRYMSRLWNTLSSSQPDMADLLATGIAMKGTLEKIDEAFRRLMSLNSESTQVLRAMASYLMNLRSQPDKATELYNKASRIDDATRKQRMKPVQNVEFGASTQTQSVLEDGAAIVTISGAAALGSTSKLGEIVHVTQSASRLFGYGTSQIIGQNVAVIVPPPIDAAHDQLLASFGRRKSSKVVGKTKLVFGQRRTGEIFPMWLQISEAPPDELTAEPRFSAVVHEVVTQQDFILFGGSETQFKIHACSQRALNMLSLEAEALHTDDVSMAQYFPSIDSTFSATVPLSAGELRAISAVPAVRELNDVLGVPAASTFGTALAQGIGAGGMRLVAGSMDVASPGADSDAAEGGAHSSPTGPSRHVTFGRSGGKSAASRDINGDGSPRPRSPAFLRPKASADASSGASKPSKGKKLRRRRSSRHDQLAAAIRDGREANVIPLREQKKLGVIPVKIAGATQLILGSCQKISVAKVSTFFVLRYHSIVAQGAEGGALTTSSRPFVSLPVPSDNGASDGLGASKSKEGAALKKQGSVLASARRSSAHSMATDNQGSQASKPRPGASRIASCYSLLGGESKIDSPEEDAVGGRGSPAAQAASTADVEKATTDGTPSDRNGVSEQRTYADVPTGGDIPRDQGDEQPSGPIGILTGVQEEKLVADQEAMGAATYVLPAGPDSDYESAGDELSVPGSRFRGSENKARSFHSGTGSTRSTITKIHQLSKGAMEPEIRSIRIVLVVLAVAVLALGIGIVLYIGEVAATIRNNSASVWVAGQRRRAMQTGIDMVLWMSFQTFDANGTATGTQTLTETLEDSVRRLQADRLALDEQHGNQFAGRLSDLPGLDSGIDADYDHSVVQGLVENAAYHNDRRLQYSTNAKSAAMSEHGNGALELLRLISNEIQIAQAKLFELDAGQSANDFEGDFRLQMTLPEEVGGGTIFVPVVQHVQEIVAAMRRISRLDPRNVTVLQRDVLFLSLNSDIWDMAMGHSLEMRYVEFSEVFTRTVEQVIIFGACVVLVYNVLGSIVFAQLSNSLGSKVQLVLQTFLLLPRPMARKLATKSQQQLNEVLREIDQDMASDSEDDDEEEYYDEDRELDDAEKQPQQDLQPLSMVVSLPSGTTSDRGNASGPPSQAPSKQRRSSMASVTSTRELLAQSLGQGAAAADAAGATVGDRPGGRRGSILRAQDSRRGSVTEQSVTIVEGGAARMPARRRSSVSKMTTRANREALLNKALGSLREHTDSSYFVVRSTCWLLLPILLVLGFIAFFVLWQLAFTQVMLRTSQRIIASSSLETQLAGTTNTMLSLNSAIARGVTSDVIIELARVADLQGQKTTAVSAVLTFGGEAVLTKLLVANSSRADGVLGRISNAEVKLEAIQNGGDPGGSAAYDVMHSDSCTATIWPNITTDIALGRIDSSAGEPAESDATSQDYIDTLTMCLEREGGVLGEGALSAVATVVFNLRQAVSAVFQDLEGLPPPSMRDNTADDISVIRRQRRLLDLAGVGGEDGASRNWEHMAGIDGAWEEASDRHTIRSDDFNNAADLLALASCDDAKQGDEVEQRHSCHPTDNRFLQADTNYTGVEDAPAPSTTTGLTASTVQTMVEFTIKIRSIVNPFLMHSISAVRINFFLGLNASLIEGQSLVEVAAWVFVSVFLLTSIMYWPAVASLNLPLTSARQMLLLLPEDTILKIRVLRTALHRIATQHESSLAGSGSASTDGGDMDASVGV